MHTVLRQSYLRLIYSLYLCSFERGFFQSKAKHEKENKNKNLGISFLKSRSKYKSTKLCEISTTVFQQFCKRSIESLKLKRSSLLQREMGPYWISTIHYCMCQPQYNIKSLLSPNTEAILQFASIYWLMQQYGINYPLSKNTYLQPADTCV